LLFIDLSFKARICLGHYANKGFANPLEAKKSDKIYVTIEIADYATLRLQRSKILLAVLNAALPHPIRFKRIWHFSRGEFSVYAWQPIAPDRYVAMGMVCTKTGIYPEHSIIMYKA
jgi:hypothetical protein